jgi:hypothetical protein
MHYVNNTELSSHEEIRRQFNGALERSSSALTGVHPMIEKYPLKPRGGSLRTDAQRQGALPRCPCHGRGRQQ